MITIPLINKSNIMWFLNLRGLCFLLGFMSSPVAVQFWYPYRSNFLAWLAHPYPLPGGEHLASMLPCATCVFERNFVYGQDNSTPHTVRDTTAFLDAHWVTHSPTLGKTQRTPSVIYVENVNFDWFNQYLCTGEIITAPIYNAYPLETGAVIVKISFQFAR